MKLRTMTAWVLTTVLMASCAATDTRRSTGEYVDDTTLLTRTKAALINSADTDGMAIDVEVYRGTVQLNGTAKSHEKREAATRVVEGVSGVRAVENNLRVEPESRRTGEYIDDKTLEARVAAALARSDDVSMTAVEVEAYRGEVSLGGFVVSAEEKRRAGEIAGAVNGVRKVVNGIAVRPPAAS